MPESLMAGFTTQDTIDAMKTAGPPDDCGIVYKDPFEGKQTGAKTYGVGRTVT